MNVTTQLNSAISKASDLNISGGCGYKILHDQVLINISQIHNLRNTSSISGTLSLELWALEQPYNGDGFKGHALSATTIGELSDLHFIANQNYSLPFQTPGTGTWYFTLMLREWDGIQYVTRDYVNFNAPYIVNSKPHVSRNEIDNVITVNFTGNKTASDKTLLDTNTPPKPIADPQQSAKKAPIEKAPSKKASAKKPESNVNAKTSVTKISINSATASQLEMVKGMSKKLAQNIVADRPFKTLDETLQVKGMGPKLLQKIRSFLSL